MVKRQKSWQSESSPFFQTEVIRQLSKVLSSISFYYNYLEKKKWAYLPNLLPQHLLPKNKFLDWFKLKAFTDKIPVTEKLKLVLERVENTVRKRENDGYQHSFPFAQCFQKASFSRLMKVRLVR